MSEFLTLHEPALRLGVFISVALAMAGWEAIAPRRPLAGGRRRRWPVNLGLVAINTALVRIAFPAAVVTATALWAESRGIGIFNMMALPRGLAIALSVVALDLVIYGQHLAFHHVRPLWRLHRVHHADLDVDFTTGVRFHPVEILLSVLVKLAAVTALGAPAAAAVIFEITLNASSMFNHGNLRLAPAFERVLRIAVVTPDMHRVHHSVIRAETDSNFGFCLSLWDRLFATYRDSPAKGHEAMAIGLPAYRDQRDQGLGRLLLNPLESADDRNDTKMP